jgi:Ca2+-binding EF-hand superfamily protein
MSAALKIQGRKGRHEVLINGSYESTGQTHNDRPVWVARAVQPVYVFHTGKSRWVVSKRIDDGARCYAYIEDAGKDPLKASGNWICCDSDGQWRADTNVHMTAGVASNDKFVQLRMTLDSELDKLNLRSPEHLKQLWKRLDFNGNNIVSLAEIDKLVVEMTKGGTWPAWLNNKPALMRAYKKTTLREGNGDSWVQKFEFSSLLLNIFWFNKLFQIFNAIDGDDRRIDLGEFQKGLAQLGLHMSAQEAQLEFQKIDSNHGGQVLFVEFCAYVRNRVNPDHDKAFDADIVSGEMCGQVMRKHHGHHATHAHFITKKCFADFDALEKQIQATIKDHAKLLDLWHRIDFNGNNIVSLAEIDKLVVEKYPLLNHKPALMRAYKATIKAGNGDDWVQKAEFKSLLANLFYFNKLFWLFEDVDADHDRRMAFPEFKKLLTITGCMQKMSEAECHADFRKVDKNGGGIILFNEFCIYFTHKECPQSLGAFMD